MLSPDRGHAARGAAGTAEGWRSRSPAASPSSTERLSLERACARAALLGEHLLAEGAALGGVRTSLAPERVRFPRPGRVEIVAGAEEDERSEEPRELTCLLGTLLFHWLCGGPPPKRAAMYIAYERSLRRALGNAELEPEATELLRRFLAWDPARRPWPELAVAQLRELAGPALEAEPPLELPREDSPTERATEEMEPPTELAEPALATTAPPPEAPLPEAPPPEAPRPEAPLPEVSPILVEPIQVLEPLGAPFALSEGHELLFIPDTTAAELERVQDPFSIPDHTMVVPFRYRHAIGEGTLGEDDATDPEVYGATSEDDRTDPEGSQAIAVSVGLDDSFPDAPSRAIFEDDPEPPLAPVPAPMGVRLDTSPATPAPARQTSPAPTARRTGLWLTLSVVLAFVLGAALFWP